MRKHSISMVMAIFLLSLVSFAEAIMPFTGSSPAIMTPPNTPTAADNKCVIFNVSPQQFQNVEKIFTQKNPEFSCHGWYYSFEDQEYQGNCAKGDNRATISLTMDGFVKIKLTKDFKYEESTVEIKRWDR